MIMMSVNPIPALSKDIWTFTVRVLEKGHNSKTQASWQLFHAGQHDTGVM